MPQKPEGLKGVHQTQHCQLGEGRDCSVVLCAVQPSPVPHLARLEGLAWFLAHPSPCTLFGRHVGLSHTCVVALTRGVSLLLFAPILHHPPRGLTLPPLCPQPTSSPVQKPRLPVAKAKPKKAKGLFS